MIYFRRSAKAMAFDYGRGSYSPRICYLMYAGTVLAVSDDPNALLALKAKCVFNGSVRYPDMLSITFGGKSWVFDRSFDKKSASRYLAGER